MWLLGDDNKSGRPRGEKVNGVCIGVGVGGGQYLDLIGFLPSAK